MQKKMVKAYQKALDEFEQELKPVGVGKWTNPNGGYFISFYAFREITICYILSHGYYTTIYSIPAIISLQKSYEKLLITSLKL